MGAYGDDDNGPNSGSAYIFVFAPTDGDPCTNGEQCVSGHCVDDVCCNTACGDGDPDDCQACSEAAGASSDGVCDEALTGTSCDDGLYCNGTDTCQAGSCSHAGDPCPGPDGDDDCVESCDETEDECTAHDPNGSSCDDGLFCTDRDSCLNGDCGGSGDPCPGPDGAENCAESCDESADSCTANDPPGEPCGPMTCSGRFLNSLLCDGSGQCVRQQLFCDPYVCSLTDDACLKSCTTDADCASAYHCGPTGECVPKESPLPPADEASCNCRLTGRRGGPALGSLAPLLLLGLALARRRQARRHGPPPEWR